MRVWPAYLVVAVMLLTPVAGSAQINATQFFPGICGSGSDTGRLSASVKVGYSNIGMNFNLPIVAPNAASVVIPLDFRLRDSNVWVGSVNFGFPLTRNFALFGNAEANAQRNVIGATDVVTPVQGGSQPLNIEWTGSKFQWWLLEAGAAFRTPYNFWMLAGVKYDKLTTGLKDPREPSGFFQNPLFGRYSGDVLVKQWIPYLGIRIEGTSFRSNLLYSPWIPTNLTLPLNAYLGLGDPAVEVDSVLTGTSFSFKRNWGTFVEATLESDVKTQQGFTISLWAKANYIKLQGRGSEDMTINGSAVGPGWGPVSFGFSESSSTTGTFTRYSLSGGIAAGVSF